MSRTTRLSAVYFNALSTQLALTRPNLIHIAVSVSPSASANSRLTNSSVSNMYNSGPTRLQQYMAVETERWMALSLRGCLQSGNAVKNISSRPRPI